MNLTIPSGEAVYQMNKESSISYNHSNRIPAGKWEKLPIHGSNKAVEIPNTPKKMLFNGAMAFAGMV